MMRRKKKKFGKERISHVSFFCLGLNVLVFFLTNKKREMIEKFLDLYLLLSVLIFNTPLSSKQIKYNLLAIGPLFRADLAYRSENVLTIRCNHIESGAHPVNELF